MNRVARGLILPCVTFLFQFQSTIPPNFPTTPASQDPVLIKPNRTARATVMMNPQLLTGLGAVLSIFFSAVGTSLASIPAGLFLVKSQNGIAPFAPIVIAGVLAIYGTILAIILCGKMNNMDLSEVDGCRHFTAGLAVGLACLASGYGMAEFLKKNLVGTKEDQQSSDIPEHEQELLVRTRSGPTKPTIKFLMVLVFLEAIGLYGLIVGLFLAS